MEIWLLVISGILIMLICYMVGHKAGQKEAVKQLDYILNDSLTSDNNMGDI